MKRFYKYTASVLIAAVLAFSCTTIKYIPVETVREVQVHDTTYLHRTDTLVRVPEVSIADYIDVGDTLRLEAPYATMSAWVDTTFNQLKGTLRQGGKLPVTIVEKERVVYRDSVVKQEIPVPVEVVKEKKYTPWYTKALAFVGILALIYLAVKVFLIKKV